MNWGLCCTPFPDARVNLSSDYKTALFGLMPLPPKNAGEWIPTSLDFCWVKCCDSGLLDVFVMFNARSCCTSCPLSWAKFEELLPQWLRPCFGQHLTSLSQLVRGSWTPSKSWFQQILEHLSQQKVYCLPSITSSLYFLLFTEESVFDVYLQVKYQLYRFYHLLFHAPHDRVGSFGERVRSCICCQMCRDFPNFSHPFWIILLPYGASLAAFTYLKLCLTRLHYLWSFKVVNSREFRVQNKLQTSEFEPGL